MADVQNHIHLATTVDLSGEKAPPYKWKASDRIEVPRVFLNVQYAMTGKARLHVLKDVGVPVQPVDFKFILRVDAVGGMTTAQRRDLLKGFHGKYVYFCDVYHPDDSADHTSAVRLMICDHVGEFKQFVPILDRYFVEISLIDAHTVT